MEKDEWNDLNLASPILSCMACCSYENKIYFGGGKNSNWSKVADFYSLDVKKRVIKREPKLLSVRTSHQLATINDLIYSIGGFDDAGNGILSVEAFSPITNQWSTVTSVPGTISKTWPQCLGVSNSRLYISVFHTPFNTFEIKQKAYYYDFKLDIWSDAPVINEKARYCTTCALVFPNLKINGSDVTTTMSSDKHRSSTTIHVNRKQRKQQTKLNISSLNQNNF